MMNQASALAWALNLIDDDPEVTLRRSELVRMLEDYGEAREDGARANYLYRKQPNPNCEAAVMYATRYSNALDRATAMIRRARTLTDRHGDPA